MSRAIRPAQDATLIEPPGDRVPGILRLCPGSRQSRRPPPPSSQTSTIAAISRADRKGAGPVISPGSRRAACRGSMTRLCLMRDFGSALNGPQQGRTRDQHRRFRRSRGCIARSDMTARQRPVPRSPVRKRTRGAPAQTTTRETITAHDDHAADDAARASRPAFHNPERF